eukprot:scaffold2456_cov129-Isochrysis_galbana.AAC.2
MKRPGWRVGNARRAERGARKAKHRAQRSRSTERICRRVVYVIARCARARGSPRSADAGRGLHSRRWCVVLVCRAQAYGHTERLYYICVCCARAPARAQRKQGLQHFRAQDRGCSLLARLGALTREREQRPPPAPAAGPQVAYRTARTHHTPPSIEAEAEGGPSKEAPPH